MGCLKNINQKYLFILEKKRNRITRELLVYVKKQPVYNTEKEALLYTTHQ